MHRLLKRQLKRIYGKSFDFDQLLGHEKQFIDIISLTYEENDKERRFYEHTVEVNSRELNEKNRAINKVLTSLAEAQRLAHTGSWFLNLNHHTLEWSDELYRIFELEPKAIRPSADYILPLIHPDDRNRADPDLHITHDSGVFDCIYRLRFDSGNVKYVREHREILRDYKNEPYAIQGIIQDVTAQKKAEKGVHLYANVFHNIGESILITNKENKIIAVNTAFTKNTGYTFEELQDKDPKILSDGSTPHHVYENMWSELKNTGFWQGELNDRKKSGETYPKWMSISVSYSDAGEVLHYIASFADISKRKADQERIHYLAHHDALTGLLNRFSLEERLSQAITIAQRNHNKLALLFIDMDRFKTINDTLGHPIGDALLVEVANRLKQCVRECDVVARIGGDEFVILLSEIKDSLLVAPIARLIVEMLGKPYTINNQKVFSSSSIGISLFPSNGDNYERLMKNADNAMYHAKDLGRNNYQFFTESLNAVADERLKLENDLRYAIENKHFELYYQPQICTITNTICGVEALVRWHHSKQGFITPDKFIPLAEESKLIVPLGLWVLEQACQQQSQWQKEYHKRIKMAVNISAQQLHETDLVKKIQLLMKTYNMSKGDLELEITESTAMQNPDDAILLLREIRELDVELAIDDFGTGYSSLAYLKLLPINTLKLDSTFVRDIEFDNNDAEISAATLALAHNLGLSVVAEGVETATQKDFLIAHDCEILQGYYFSKPLPADEAAEFIFRQ
ncbi:MAG: EAL domain-containing protein [Gammaproteobacteria bacterium]|nr:EAL domain-containing protein [Gammaproteobacteria bacterium]